MVHKSGWVEQNANAHSRKLINLVGLCPSLETLGLAQAQGQDRVLAKSRRTPASGRLSPYPREWLTYPLKNYTTNNMVTTGTGGLHDLPQAQVSHHGARETSDCGP